MTAETREFKAEMKQLMDLIVHSLYSHKDVFLRELISNAVDAIDKARFLGLTDSSILEDDSDWKVKLIVDKDAGTLTVSDNGVGMSMDTVADQLGTVARSGTADFLARLKDADAKDRPELIGQFGVGFYAAFMVADKVTVLSRMAGDPSDGVRWESDGGGTYSLERVSKERRGTDVTLHLRDDAKELLELWKLREIVQRFSDFVEHPIVMDVERPVVDAESEGDDGPKMETVEETLNAQKAIWLRSKSDVTEEDYKDFYKHLTRDSEPPLETIHYVAEGTMEFRALLFVPSKRPPAFLGVDPTKGGPQLYVNRVFITDDAEALLPPYLRFVRGVVDSSDLPLNVSREVLQDNPLVPRIQRALVGKILGALETIAKDRPEDYSRFFEAWGGLLKLGVTTSFEDRDRLANLLRYESTHTEPGERTSLKDYVERMGEKQDAIYYLIGASREALDGSPYLEAFRARGEEVLLMTDPADEWVATGLGSYEEKPLKGVDRGELEHDDPEESDDGKEERAKRFEDLLAFVRANVEEVKDVRLSQRLRESAAVLVVDEGQMGAQMETLLKSLGQPDVPEVDRILEINAEHPAVEAMQARFAEAPEDPKLVDYARLLYDQAVLAEGGRPKDIRELSRRVNDLIAADAKRASQSPEEGVSGASD